MNKNVLVFTYSSEIHMLAITYQCLTKYKRLKVSGRERTGNLSTYWHHPPPVPPPPPPQKKHTKKTKNRWTEIEHSSSYIVLYINLSYFIGNSYSCPGKNKQANIVSPSIPKEAFMQCLLASFGKMKFCYPSPKTIHYIYIIYVPWP